MCAFHTLSFRQIILLIYSSLRYNRWNMTPILTSRFLLLSWILLDFDRTARMLKNAALEITTRDHRVMIAAGWLVKLPWLFYEDGLLLYSTKHFLFSCSHLCFDSGLHLRVSACVQTFLNKREIDALFSFVSQFKSPEPHDIPVAPQRCHLAQCKNSHPQQKNAATQGTFVFDSLPAAESIPSQTTLSHCKRNALEGTWKCSESISPERWSLSASRWTPVTYTTYGLNSTVLIQLIIWIKKHNSKPDMDFVLKIIIILCKIV